jgi:hypothetical protein
MSWRNRIFGKRRPSALELLNGASWTCRSCHEQHRGMFDLAADSPDQWDQPLTVEPNSALRFHGNFLSEDLCVLDGEHFFVRCVFEIPVHGLAEKFGYGCWSTLSRQNFDLYIEGFDSGDYAGMGPWFGWFSNRLRGFADSLNQKCWVYPQPGRQRPVIALADPDHELAIAQDEGITPERLLELYAAYGHGPLMDEAGNRGSCR